VARDDEDTTKITQETIELIQPFDYMGEQVTELTLRRPKMKDLRRIGAAKGTDADRAALMIQILSGLSPKAVDEIDGVDIDKISKVIDSFS